MYFKLVLDFFLLLKITLCPSLSICSCWCAEPGHPVSSQALEIVLFTGRRYKEGSAWHCVWVSFTAFIVWPEFLGSE